MTKKKTLQWVVSMAAVGLGIGLAAQAHANVCEGTSKWNTGINGACGGLADFIGSTSNDGSFKYVCAQLKSGIRASIAAKLPNGQPNLNCTATDTVADGTSASDQTGCNTALSYVYQVQY